MCTERLITIKVELVSKVMEIVVVIVCSELQIVLSGKNILTNPSKEYQQSVNQCAILWHAVNEEGFVSKACKIQRISL